MSDTSSRWLQKCLLGLCGSFVLATHSYAVSLLSKTVGEASYYGPHFHGKCCTANGERVNMYDLTAAHRVLPFGTRLKVTNLKNKKSVIVRINDRGPFRSARIIDLSLAAFNKIASQKAGVIKVRLELVEKTPASMRSPGPKPAVLKPSNKVLKMSPPPLKP